MYPRAPAPVPDIVAPVPDIIAPLPESAAPVAPDADLQETVDPIIAATGLVGPEDGVPPSESEGHMHFVKFE